MGKSLTNSAKAYPLTFTSEAERRHRALEQRLPRDGRAVYRCNADTVVNGTLRYAGSEVEFLGWPEPHIQLEPLNDDARAIVAYLGRNPVRDRYRMPYRDGVLDLSEPELMPLWKARASKRGLELVRCMGDVRFASQSFRSPDWPDELAIPISQEAKRVVEYYARNRNHPDLPAKPWDAAKSALNLPDLGEI